MPIRVKAKKVPGQRDHSPDARGYGSAPLPKIGEGDRFRDVIKKLSRFVTSCVVPIVCDACTDGAFGSL